MRTPIPEFRRFALGVYGVEEVPPAALFLQDSTGVDVPLLLLAAYAAAAQGRTLNARDVTEARARVAAWHTEVVRPLRGVRTRLKTGPPPAPSAVTAGFRERVKALELDAEMIELDELALYAGELGKGHPETSGTTSRYTRVENSIRAVVVDRTGRDLTSDECRAVRTIALAATEYAEEG